MPKNQSADIYDRDLAWNRYLHEMIYEKIRNSNYNVLEEVENAMHAVWGNKVPCNECNDLEPYEIVQCDGKISDSFGIENDFYKCICKKCGKEVYVGTITETEVAIAQNEQIKFLEQKRGVITRLMIRELPLKYNIDVDSLAIVLGLQDSFERYYEFGLPPKQQSDFLTKIYTNPALFLELLELNVDKISKEAYFRSLSATTYLVINGDDDISKTQTQGSSLSKTRK